MEQENHKNLGRIANSLEKIAKVMEQEVEEDAKCDSTDKMKELHNMFDGLKSKGKSSEEMDKEIKKMLKDKFPGAIAISSEDLKNMMGNPLEGLKEMLEGKISKMKDIEEMLDQEPTPGCDCPACALKKDFQKFKKNHKK